MSQYFEKFPSIKYSGITAKNITLRASMIDSFRQNANNFYPYTIKDGETADSIAYKYYGDCNFVWLIYITNNIIDPYCEWPLDTLEFERFIISKYGSLAIAKQTTVYYKKIAVNYYMNNDTNDFMLASEYNPIVHGYNWSKAVMSDDIKISSDNNPDPAVWQEIDAYTDEFEQNEQKRYISLLSDTYATAVARQLRDIMNE